MVKIEQLAEAALSGDSLLLRSLTQDFLRERSRLGEYPRPSTTDRRVLAVAASLIELFAMRRQQNPPQWTKDVEPLPEPIFLLKSVAGMARLRALCETQSPEPLRRRGLYAPPNFLEFA